MPVTFQPINPDGLKDIVTNSLTEEGYRTVNTMKSEAARDSGELRSGLTSGVEGTTLTIEATADHSGYVEYGTGVYNENGNGRGTPWVYFHARLGRFITTKGMQSQPFFRHNMEKLEKTLPATIASRLDSWGRK